MDRINQELQGVPPLPVRSQVFNCLGLLTAAHPLIETDFFQTQAGRFQGDVLGIALPNGYFWRSRWNLGGPGTGELRDGYLMVGLPTSPYRDFWHGREIRGETVATSTHSLGLRHRCSQAHESLAWMIRWSRIYEICEHLDVPIPGTLGSEPVHTGSELLLRLYRRDIQEFIERAPQKGELSRPLAVWFEEFLVHRLLSFLNPVSPAPCPIRTSAGVAEKIAQQLRLRENGPLVMSDLCAELHLHERTLRQHFTCHFGISPQAYHQNLRLNRLRQLLLTGKDSRGQISHYAARLGFWHMGRLGQQYRRLFGETPSETLACKACDQFSQFWKEIYCGSSDTNP